MPHRIRTNFLVTAELVCWSTREVGTAKPRSLKRFDLAYAARDKHNSGFRAVASKVIHRFNTDEPASASFGQSRVMHPLKKATIARAMALALVSVAMWQYQSGQSLASPTQQWSAPLDAPLQLVNPFYQPNSDYSAGHRGVDYLVRPGQQVLAPTDAVVWFSGLVVDRSVLSLRTASGDLLAFEPVCGRFDVGQSVKRGDVIGHLCEAKANYRQHCEGQLCMHFSLRTPNGYLSPLVRWGALSPTVLLPVD